MEEANKQVIQLKEFQKKGEKETRSRVSGKEKVRTTKTLTAIEEITGTTKPHKMFKHAAPKKAVS
jgi:hypothetical protein